MIDMTKQYRTRDGRDVRLLCVDGPNAKYPVVAIIAGQNHVSEFTADGDFDVQPATLDQLDLIEVKPERTGWLNVYLYEGFHDMATRVYADKAAADSMALNQTAHKRIACLQITYREGDGL